MNRCTGSQVTRNPQSFADRNRRQSEPGGTGRGAGSCGQRRQRLIGWSRWLECARGASLEPDHGLLLCRQQLPVDEPIILLNGEGRAAGPVNNVAVMSAVSSGYAPPGAHLVVASVVGESPQENAALLRLDDEVRTHLRKWFGPAVDSWKLLKAYPISRALPQQRHAEWEQAPVRLGGSRRCLHVWRLPRNGLHPGGSGLRQAGRGGGASRPRRQGKWGRLLT